MTIKKNKNGLWDVQFYYKDYSGQNVKKHKRNFKTKKKLRNGQSSLFHSNRVILIWIFSRSISCTKMI